MNSTTRILLAGSAIVVASFLVNSLLPEAYHLTDDALSAFFTGLGIVGLIATLQHEREQAAGQDTDHAELIAALRDQIEAQNRLTRFEALAHRYDRTHAAWQKTQMPHSSEKLLARSQELRAELGRLEEGLDRLARVDRG